MVKKAISLILITQLIILVTYIYDFSLYINFQIAFLSSLFIILGSSFAYKRMIIKEIYSKIHEDGKRDLLDTIEDPYELYEDNQINDAPVEELDLKEIVKEEKSKIKTFNLKSAKHGAKGGFSPFRLVPYIFLVLGFIALENNGYLDIFVYLPSLLVGIIVGHISSKGLFTNPIS